MVAAFFVPMAAGGGASAQSLQSGEYQVAHYTGVPHRHTRRAETAYQRRLRQYRERRQRYLQALQRQRQLQAVRQRQRTQQARQPEWVTSEDSKDPVQIVVSLPEQKLTVYQGVEPIVTSRISSGKAGHSTPAGVFSILRKKRYHRSNIYSGAPMPFMQRLTWSGIALHQSNAVPDYPASHGCVRMPTAFASQLFKFTETGIHVVVAAEEGIKPVEIAHDNLFRPETVEPAGNHPAETEPKPTREELRVAKLPVRILITRHTGNQQLKQVQKLLDRLGFEPGDIDGYMGPDTAKAITRFQEANDMTGDGLVSDDLIAKLHEAAGLPAPTNARIYVRQNMYPVFDAPATITGDTPTGSHLYTVQHFDEDATEARWTYITLTRGSGRNAADKKQVAELDTGTMTDAVVPGPSSAMEALGRIVIDDETRRRIARMLTPGSSLAISNDGLSHETTPKGSDFILLMQ